MQLPKNHFKAALARGERQLGCWLSLANPYAAELAATAGFDWYVIDGEHAPNDVSSILTQLQVLAAYPGQPVVRLVAGEVWMIKQALDLGAQTLLIPLVDSPEQARALVRAMRYAPSGNRGMGARVTRASRWGAVQNYATAAEDELCLIVQVETRAGLAALEAIAAVEGVDGVFFGPSDLAADLGFLGKPDASEVAKVIDEAIVRVRAAGKAAGTLTNSFDRAEALFARGAQFIAVASDTGALAEGLRARAAEFGRLRERSGGVL